MAILLFDPAPAGAGLIAAGRFPWRPRRERTRLHLADRVGPLEAHGVRVVSLLDGFLQVAAHVLAQRRVLGQTRDSFRPLARVAGDEAATAVRLLVELNIAGKRRGD